MLIDGGSNRVNPNNILQEDSIVVRGTKWMAGSSKIISAVLRQARVKYIAIGLYDIAFIPSR